MDRDELEYTLEFHNEIDDVPASQHPLLDRVVARLAKLSRGNDDVSHAMVNFKKPGQRSQSPDAYELTIRLHMDGKDVVVTEQGNDLDTTLNALLDVLDRQVRTQRARKRGH